MTLIEEKRIGYEFYAQVHSKGFEPAVEWLKATLKVNTVAEAKAWIDALHDKACQTWSAKALEAVPEGLTVRAHVETVLGEHWRVIAEPGHFKVQAYESYAWRDYGARNDLTGALRLLADSIENGPEDTLAL